MVSQEAVVQQPPEAARRVRMPSWIGPWEIVIIVVIILVLFGGRLIPRIGRSLGGSLVGLKKGLKEGEEGFKEALKEDKEEPVAAKKTPVVDAAAKNGEDKQG
jgi:sec-independent protein translocase protein TatA